MTAPSKFWVPPNSVCARLSRFSSTWTRAPPCSGRSSCRRAPRSGDACAWAAASVRSSSPPWLSACGAWASRTPPGPRARRARRPPCVSTASRMAAALTASGMRAFRSRRTSRAEQERQHSADDQRDQEGAREEERVEDGEDEQPGQGDRADVDADGERRRLGRRLVPFGLHADGRVGWAAHSLRPSRAADQQHPAHHRHPDACPQRNVDALLLLHLDLHGPDLGRGLVLRVGEAPVGDRPAGPRPAARCPRRAGRSRVVHLDALLGAAARHRDHHAEPDRDQQPDARPGRADRAAARPSSTSRAARRR